MRSADLHLHTIFSDGTYTPGELVKEAKRAGLSCISIVDHDTVLGISPAFELVESENIEVLAGIELSAEYRGREVHILGYLIDYKNRDLLEQLEILKKNRIERIYKIADKLKAIGIKLNAETVLDIAKHGTVGRLHVARALVKEGWVASVYEAFEKYIGERGPGFCLGFRLTPYEAINLIKGAGGIPVLAHPYILNQEGLVMEIINYGIMGLEVYYPEHSASMIDAYLNLAKKYNLLISGGSDFHGNVKPEVRIGSVKISYDLVEKIKAAKVKI